jgi:predicted nucleic acid-binding protein
MIVLDASAMIELLLDQPHANWVATSAQDRTVASPEILHLEVAQVLRRYVRGRSINARRAGEALADLREIRVRTYGHEALLARIWELRDVASAYDAAYLALAEALDAPLVTTDLRLVASGHAAVVQTPG